MKIALFTYRYGTSGSGHAVEQLARYLVTLDHQVSVYDSVGMFDINDGTFVPHKFLTRIIRVFRNLINSLLRLPLKHAQFVNLNLFQSSLINIPKTYDLYNFHWIHNDFISLREIAEIPSDKILITQHDYWWADGLYHIDIDEEEIPEIYKKIQRRNLSNIRLLIDQKTNFICPSNWLRTAFAQKHNGHNPISHKLFNIVETNRTNTKITTNLNTPFKIAIAAWNMNWYKGDDLAKSIIDGFSLINECFELHIYGSDKSTVFSNCSYPIINHGRISQEELFNKLSCMDVLLYCSRFDNLPNLLIEASLLNLPVVCLDVGGCAEIIKHEVNGFVHKPSDLKGAQTSLNFLSKADFQTNSIEIQKEIMKSKTFYKTQYNDK